MTSTLTKLLEQLAHDQELDAVKNELSQRAVALEKEGNRARMFTYNKLWWICDCLQRDE